MRALFAELPVRLHFERAVLRVPCPTPDAYVDHTAERSGPWIKAREALGPAGWDRVDADLRALVARYHRDGAVELEYLVIVGDRFA